jgi:CrcB protein
VRVLLVAAGGAAGSVARYFLDGVVYSYLSPTFPYGTFVVNMTGCLLFGLLIGVAEDRLAVGTATRTFILIGILGGFTTFSSFTFETVQLLRAGQWLRGTVNVVGQVFGGLVMLWAGITIPRMVWR